MSRYLRLGVPGGWQPLCHSSQSRHGAQRDQGGALSRGDAGQLVNVYPLIGSIKAQGADAGGVGNLPEVNDAILATA